MGLQAALGWEVVLHAFEQVAGQSPGQPVATGVAKSRFELPPGNLRVCDLNPLMDSLMLKTQFCSQPYPSFLTIMFTLLEEIQSDSRRHV